MEQQNVQNQTNNTNPKLEDSASYSLRDIFEMVVANWYWFVISIGLCMVVATYYVYKTPKVYQRSSTIMIKDSRRGGSAAAIFADLSSMKAIPNVDNEMFILGSKRLMEIVVDTLNLNIVYTYSGKVRTADLYDKTPVVCEFPNGLDWQSLRFEMTPMDSSRIKLTNFLMGQQEEPDKTIVWAMAGETVETPVGLVKLSPTAYYDSYKERTIKVSKRPLEQTALAYKNALKVSMAAKESSIILLSINDVNPKRAEDVLNSLMVAYDDDVREDKNIVLEVTKDFISKRIEEVTAELASIDRAAQNYSVQHKVVDLSSQTSLSISEANKYKTEAIGIETQKMLVKSIREYMSDVDRVWDVVPTAGLNDAYIIEAIAEYNSGLLQRRKLLESSSDRNPIVQQLSSSLNSQRQAILSYVDNLLNQYEVSLKTARAQEEASTKQYMSAPMKLVGQMSIERRQTIKSEQYAYLLSKQEENELGRAVSSSESRIIDLAYGSTYPVAPKTMLILLVAFVLGCAIPFGVIIVMNLLNTTVRGRKDIEDVLTVPMLGEVPQSTQKQTQGFIVKEHGKDPVSEAFRMVRSNLGFMKSGSGCQVLMITSTNASSGKTFTSMNLAYTLATSGKKVIMIDNDMRKRSLSKQLGGRSIAMGLSRYLSDENVTVDEIINSSKTQENLDVIFAGLQPPNPAELLMNSRFDTLVAELRKRYDYVIIDSVPALVVADAIIADRVCDLSLYVIREGRMDRRMLPDVQRLADSKRLHNMAVILNGVRDMTKRYGYGYGYRYGYYSYSYGEGEKTSFVSRLRKRLFR